jgi:hypothetical protein
MSRRRFIQAKDGALHEVPKDYVPEQTDAPVIQGDAPGYLSHATGKWVEGNVQRREDLAVSGCRPFEGVESEAREAARHRAYNEAARDAAVEKKLAEFMPHMSSDARGALLHNDVSREFNERAARQRREQANRRG